MKTKSHQSKSETCSDITAALDLATYISGYLASSTSANDEFKKVLVDLSFCVVDDFFKNLPNSKQERLRRVRLIFEALSIIKDDKSLGDREAKLIYLSCKLMSISISS